MSGTLKAMSAELRIIRSAKRQGRKLKVHPMLLSSAPIAAREAHLRAVLEPDAAA